jgi:hypothetical protein
MHKRRREWWAIPAIASKIQAGREFFAIRES